MSTNFAEFIRIYCYYQLILGHSIIRVRILKRFWWCIWLY